MVDPGPAKREVLQEGTLIANRFRIERLLGAGGMASVYRAYDTQLAHSVALKLLRKDLCSTPEAVTRFRREGELLTALAHPAIVRIESYGEVGDGSLYLAMELLEGETLGQLLRREHTIEPRELATLLAGAGAGLIAAHAKNVVHRDLKPDNIFLARNPQTGEINVKLLDFGISKVFGSERLTMTGQVLGTPRYMSPEQLAADTNLDTRVDIYALGVILYEAIAGQQPFLATNPSDLLVAILHGDAVPIRSVNKDVTEAVASVVMRAMSRLASARFAKVADLVDAYIHAVGHEAAHKPVRRGMPTRVVGSFGFSEPPEPKSGSFEESEVGFAGALRPGTLGQLPQAKPDAHAPLAVQPAEPPQRDIESSHRAIETPKRAMPKTLQQNPSLFAQPAVPSPAHAVQPAAQPNEPNISADPSVNLPMQGNQSFVLVIAIVAGALSAALAIFGLSYCGKHDDAPASPTALVSAAVALDAGLLAELDSGAMLVHDASAIPVGAEPPSPSIDRAAPARTNIERSSASRSRQTARAVAEIPATPPTPASSAPPGSELLTQAREAQRASNFDDCVSLARQALAQGAPSAALRLEGDCLRRGGRNAEALVAYQRFCRVAPDHPAIAEVRALAESLGGPCH